MKIVRVYSLVNHKATSASVVKAHSRGDTIVFMCCEKRVPPELRTIEGVIFIDPSKTGYFGKFKNVCKKFDYIFFHSLAEDYSFALNMLMAPSLLKRTVWIIVGGDLYSWAQPVCGRIYKQLGARIRNSIAKLYRQKIPYVICSAIDEYKYKSDFGRAIVFVNESNNPGYAFSEIEKYRPQSDSRAPLRIMIGHSSSKELSHKEVIQKLLSLDLPSDTEYLFPLSYGNKEYGDLIEREAIEAFGNKAKIFREKIQFPDYVRLLWSVDCAIFHTDRQIAFGNILMLLYMKKKLFFKKGSVLWNYMSERGVTVFDSANMTKEEIIERVFDSEPGRILAQKVNDQQLSASESEQILHGLEKRLRS